MAQVPVSCRYFYGDYHRGRNREACRLLEANPNNPRPWNRKLCDSCPVPTLLLSSNTPELVLEAEVNRKFLWNRVEVTFAICQKHLIELDNPAYCPECAKENV